MPKLAVKKRMTSPRMRSQPKGRWKRGGSLLFSQLKLLSLIVFLLGLGGGSFYFFKAWNMGQSGGLIDTLCQPFICQLDDLGFKVRKIVIEGPHFADEADIYKNLEFKEGQSIFLIDLWKTQKNIEKLPWVRSVLVQRRLPDKIYIRLSEHRPIAIWQKQAIYYLIDDRGGIIPNADVRRFAHLPLMTGEGAPTNAPSFLAQLWTYPEIAKRVTEAIYLTGRRWDLVLEHRLKIKLPEGDNAFSLAHLMDLEQKGHLRNKDIIMIDVRLKDRTLFYLSEEAYQKREAMKKLLKGKRA